MKNSIGCMCSRSSLTGYLTILACLISLVSTNASLAQGPKNSRKTVFTGIVSDTINGMLIDSVSVSAGGITTQSNARGVFTLEIPAKKTAVPNNYVLTFSRKNFNTLKRTVSAGNGTRIEAKMKSQYPLRNILHLFTDPGIPERGPHESPSSPKCADATVVPDLIGGNWVSTTLSTLAKITGASA